MRRFAPWVIISLFSLLQAWALRGEASAPSTHANDLSVHLAMVRWAADRISSGHLPFDGWFPDLALGSARFTQYQSLPHIVGGALATVFGSVTVVNWSTFVLLLAWPFAAFVGVRLLVREDVVALFAAILAPLVVSRPGYGYELGSYVWRGYGIWAQLIAMLLVPFAMAFVWRALERGRGYALAALLLAITIACHFITGYIALIFLGVAILAGPGRFGPRVARGALVGVGALLGAAWTLVPVVTDRKWIASTQFDAPEVRNSFGARRVLGWLFTGRLFDNDHTWLPIITILLLVGVVVCAVRFRRDALARTLLCFWVVNLVLYFGRPTLGRALDFVPFTKDLVLHRFIIGVHLGGILLAAIGGTACVRGAWHFLQRHRASVSPALGAALLVLLVAALVVPAWAERASYLATDRNIINDQKTALRHSGRNVNTLIDVAKREGGGRIYAGTQENFGILFRMGFVPVYIQVFERGAQGIGFFDRAASLSNDPEHRFDLRRPSHYPLFGVRWLIMPHRIPAPVPAEKVAERGRFTLYRVDDPGYLGVYDTVGPAITADRTNLGTKVVPYLESKLPDRHSTRPIAFEGSAAAAPTAASAPSPDDPPGTVTGERDQPNDGVYSGRVSTTRPAVVVLRESYHGRWKATVDGEERPTQMVAPSFVGVRVGAGTHDVVFTYVPYSGIKYALLFAVGVLALLALAIVPRVLERRRARTALKGARRPPFKRWNDDRRSGDVGAAARSAVERVARHDAGRPGHEVHVVVVRLRVQQARVDEVALVIRVVAVAGVGPCEVRLFRRHQRRCIRLARRGLALVGDAADREHDDPGQDAQDHDDDQEFNERETLLVLALLLPVFLPHLLLAPFLVEFHALWSRRGHSSGLAM